MIKSMTGYGRGRVLADGLDITFEIKSVNNRYMDLNIRMPRAFAPLEERVKALVGAAVSRGKVDVYIGVEHLNGECVRLSLNREYLEGYLAVLGQVGKEYGISGEVTLDMVAARSEVFLARKAEEDAEKVWPLMERAAREALDAFAAMRGAEGERLRADLLARLGVLREIAGRLDALAPEAVRAANEKMLARVCELLSGVTPDESRLLTECAVFADKTDVTEELVRLSSHFGQFETMLGEDAPVGRKCDFLVQEINREINTIGSKCCGTEMTNLVITAKSELEKIREQIQNLEPPAAQTAAVLAGTAACRRRRKADVPRFGSVLQARAPVYAPDGSAPPSVSARCKTGKQASREFYAVSA